MLKAFEAQLGKDSEDLGTQAPTGEPLVGGKEKVLYDGIKSRSSLVLWGKAPKHNNIVCTLYSLNSFW